MRLLDYPATIAQKQRELLQSEQHIRRLQDILNRLTAEVDTTIAFDSDLRNDAQRKAKRLELMKTSDYRKAVGQTHTKVHISISINFDCFIANDLINQSLLRKRLAALALCKSRLCYS